MNLQEQAVALTQQYPWNKFWWGAINDNFDIWAFRYLVGCIAVGGTNEAAVLSAAKVLFERYPTIESMMDANPEDVANILGGHGVHYSPPKARYIVESAEIIVNKFNGDVPNNRKDLESLPGVGRHVASVMLATVFNQNEFAVDLHVRRIMERWGYKGSDLALEQVVKENVDPALWGHFSRAFVDFGQTRCGHVSNCQGCTIPHCDGQEKVLPKITLKTTGGLEGYRIESTAKGWEFQAPGSDKTCIVKVNRTCTCQGFRFKKHCKHLEHVYSTQA